MNTNTPVKPFKMSKNIKRYIIKKYIMSLMVFYISISGFIFIIDLTENLRKYIKKDVSVIKIMLLSSNNIPIFLSQLHIFIILFASLHTIRSMSNRNELDIFKSLGLSIWKIITPMIVVTIIAAFINLFVISSLSIITSKNSQEIINYIENNNDENFSITTNNVWFTDRSVPYEPKYIIASSLIQEKDKNILTDVNIIEFNSQNLVSRFITASKAITAEDKIILYDVIIKNKNIKYPDNYEQYTVDNFYRQTRNIDKLSLAPQLIFVWQLPSLIKDLKVLGITSKAYEVYFYSSIFTPILSLTMLFLSARFAPNESRSSKNIIKIMISIGLAILVYFMINLVTAFSLSSYINSLFFILLAYITAILISLNLLFTKERL